MKGVSNEIVIWIGGSSRRLCTQRIARPTSNPVPTPAAAAQIKRIAASPGENVPVTSAAIANWSVFVFAVLLWVAQMLAHEAGYWFGSRRRAHGGEAQAEGVGVVVGGMLSLLAFVLALTLSFANNRFSERVEGTLVDVAAKEPLRVLKIFVDEGADVEPDEVVAQMDTVTLEAEFTHAN